MDFMTPIDTTRSLFPSLRRRCPISVPLSLSMDNCRRLCLLPIPLERPPLLQSTSFRQTQGKPKTEYNSFVRRMYSLMKKFSIPFLPPFSFRSFIRLLQTTRISPIPRRLHVSVYIDVGLPTLPASQTRKSWKTRVTIYRYKGCLWRISDPRVVLLSFVLAILRLALDTRINVSLDFDAKLLTRICTITYCITYWRRPRVKGRRVGVI